MYIYIYTHIHTYAYTYMRVIGICMAPLTRGPRIRSLHILVWNKSGAKTAGFYSKHVLWNKPTLKERIDDISLMYMNMLLNNAEHVMCLTNVR